MTVQISRSGFDPLEQLRLYQDGFGERMRQIGAAVTFVGSMRDFNQGDAVESMYLEHYPGMTEAHLESQVSSAMERWQLNDVLIVHRVGQVWPGEAIVLVAVWSAHRAHAFEACRQLMEDLKSAAPLWKKEKTASGERWITNNTPGSTAEFSE